MRILYITPFLQHPKMQSSFRHYYFVRDLARRHRITLLTPTKSPVVPEALQEMQGYTERLMIFDAVRKAPPTTEAETKALASVGRKMQDSDRLQAAVQEMKKAFLDLVARETFDVVIFHGKSVFPVIDGWDKLPIVVDFCDATSMRIAGRMAYAKPVEKPLLYLRYLQARQTEKGLLKKSPYIAFISCRDREAILGPTSRAKIIPNAVDTEYWRRKTNVRQPNCIMLHGGMDYRPNHDAAMVLIQKILPLLRPALPDLEVLIVGRDPLPALIKAAQNNPGVTVTGGVDDIRPYLERATVYTAPLRFASGQQNKLLEALAMEVPVVTTPVASAGLRVDDGVESPVVVAQTDQQFADAVIDLFKRKAERDRLSLVGRQYIEHYFTEAHSVEVLEAMCDEAIKAFAKQGKPAIKQAV
ncbi:MAG: glycosyltransferase [Chloroflexi bacterium]|nr:glycosyltransferase [Chloroflexota bacterium]